MKRAVVATVAVLGTCCAGCWGTVGAVIEGVSAAVSGVGFVTQILSLFGL